MLCTLYISKLSKTKSRDDLDSEFGAAHIDSCSKKSATIINASLNQLNLINLTFYLLKLPLQ